MKRILVTMLLVGGAAAGCIKDNHPAVANPPEAHSVTGASRPGEPTQVVATIDGHAVTVKDVDAIIAAQLGQLQQQFQAEQFALRKQGLDAVLFMRLADTEAKKDGTTEQAWVKQRVEASAPAATEADAKTFYDQNSARMGSRTFDQEKSRIMAFLTNQKREVEVEKLFADLKSKAKIEITLKQPANVVADSHEVPPKK